MNILQLSVLDTIGRRFNGADLNKYFLSIGHEPAHYVWEKLGNDPRTYKLGTPFVKWGLYYAPRVIEKIFSLQSLLSLTPVAFALSKCFRNSDIVHYHLIQNNYFNIAALPFLSHTKPSVWTLHDMWPLTGHCVYSFDCERWRIGCGECPYLDTHIAMKYDRTAFMWKMKKLIYSRSSLDIIVASKWMLNKVKTSPLLSELPIHLIPFGIDTDIFSAQSKILSRSLLGIQCDNFVVGVRSSNSKFKGLSQFKECLRKIHSNRPITILTFDVKGLLDEFKDRYQVVDCGWIDDEMKIRDIYNAMDIFVIPSLTESFNLMAIEAMSCEVPVVAFDTTPVCDLFFRDFAGITVPYGDSKAMAHAVQTLIENENQKNILAKNGRKLALEHYKFKVQAQKILEVYKTSINRWKKTFK